MHSHDVRELKSNARVKSLNRVLAMKYIRNETPIKVRTGQALVDDVVGLFVDLLVSGGSTIESVREALSRALNGAVGETISATITELGAIRRDCMEVMCAWRRNRQFVDENGDPLPLALNSGRNSFSQLCKRAGCKSSWEIVMKELVEFDAVRLDSHGRLVSKTPTFLGRTIAGEKLAKDVVLRQLEGYLRVVHGNVCGDVNNRKLRFERSCSVTVAAELEPVFEQLVRSRGQEFVDSVDEWLERNAKRKSTSGKYLELGAGAYFIDLGWRSTIGARGP